MKTFVENIKKSSARSIFLYDSYRRIRGYPTRSEEIEYLICLSSMKPFKFKTFLHMAFICDIIEHI